MKKILFVLSMVCLSVVGFGQTQYTSFNYKLYKMGFKAPSDFKVVKNTTTEYSINSIERGLTFFLRPVKEDASIDISDAVELAKIGMVSVNAQYSNVTIVDESAVILSGGLSGYFMNGTANDGATKINFWTMGVYNANGTMQFYGISTFPVDRRSTTNGDISRRILQSMQVLP